MTARDEAGPPADTGDTADTGEFAAWIRPNWPAMAALARQLAVRGDWEDVLQESLSAAWRKRAQFDAGRGSARNWLLAIVADQSRKSHRGLARRSRLASARREAADPDRRADTLDLHAALRELTHRQRVAVTLHYYLGLSIADAAVVMACAEGTVKSTLADARTRLRDQLGKDYR